MTFRKLFVGVAALAIALLVPLNPAGAVTNKAPVAPCSDGTLAPGTYSSITVDGFCQFMPGTIVINGSLTLNPDSGVDATNCDTHVTITGGVTVGENAILGLGGSVQGTDCPADTGDVVSNGLRATNALATIIHGTRINGGVSITGGGVQDCEFSIPGLGFPTFVDLEDSAVNGGLTITGLHTCWMGVIRNSINGGFRDMNNNFDDPDANEVQTNSIHGPLVCNGNSPAVQQGDSEGLVNIVSGPKVGECAEPGI